MLLTELLRPPTERLKEAADSSELHKPLRSVGEAINAAGNNFLLDAAAVLNDDVGTRFSPLCSLPFV